MKAALLASITLLFIVHITLGQQSQQDAALADPPWVKDVAAKPLVYTVPGMDKVQVQSAVYKRAGSRDLKMDAYRSTDPGKNTKLPAIIFIHGGFLPPNLKTQPTDWNVFQSYGRVAAASGFVGVTFNHRLYESWESLENSTSDLADVIVYVRNNAVSLGVDKDRIALWSFSGGGPLLSLAIRDPQPYIRCIISYYSLLDLQHTAKESRGALPDQALLDLSPLHQLEISEKPIAPMFIARMGQDMPNITDSVDRFILVALTKNVRLTLSNDPQGHHGFDIEDNTDVSREIIRQTFDFLKAQLGADR